MAEWNTQYLAYFASHRNYNKHEKMKMMMQYASSSTSENWLKDVSNKFGS